MLCFFPYIHNRLLLLIGAILSFGSLATAVDTIQTSSFSTCGNQTNFQLQKLNVALNKQKQSITFDIAGTSTKVQNVTGTFTVTAFGQQVFNQTFDPCDPATFLQQICPVPSGTYSVSGTQKIPDQVFGKIPSIAFDIPDLDGIIQLQLHSKDNGNQVGCVESGVSNGKSFTSPAIMGAAAGAGGVVFALSGISVLVSGAGATPGIAGATPSFFGVLTWFQFMATNGMLSVTYPPVYRSFVRNFAFSSGLVSVASMQNAIDNLRKRTGGNITTDSYQFLKNNVTFVDPETNGTLTKRLVKRQSLSLSNSTGLPTSIAAVKKQVTGIQAYVEPLLIPKENVFMTILLVTCIVIGGIIVGILLLRGILELWARCGKLPNKLIGFRNDYWWIMSQTITGFIMALYGTWTLFVVYQFIQGDSWAAKTLAGVSLGLFTAVLGFFTFAIYRKAKQFRDKDGDTQGLFEDKDTWKKYRIFYENYKKSYWWVFVPVIIYSFVRGIVIAAGDGHGLIQTASQLILESVMLVLFIAFRPFALKSGNWINIFIQVVRVLSIICVLLFLENLGIAETPKAITGIALVAIQATLTGVLFILVAANTIINLCRKNPHEERLKESEKRMTGDTLSSLDPKYSVYDGEAKKQISVTEYQTDVGYEPELGYQPDQGYSREPEYQPDQRYAQEQEYQSEVDYQPNPTLSFEDTKTSGYQNQTTNQNPPLSYLDFDPYLNDSIPNARTSSRYSRAASFSSRYSKAPTVKQTDLRVLPRATYGQSSMPPVANSAYYASSTSNETNNGQDYATPSPNPNRISSVYSTYTPPTRYT